jgi:hypothetical protein
MKVSKLLMLGLFLAMYAGAAFAASGRGAGTWHTGEMSEPQYISRWGFGSTDYATNIITADTSQTKAGTSAVKMDTTSGMDTWVYFPNTKDLDLDASQLTALKFSLRSENKNGWGGDPWGVTIKDMSGKSARISRISQGLAVTMKEWTDYTVPLGAAAEAMAAKTATYMAVEEKKRGPATFPWLVTIEPGFDWKHLGCFEIHEDTGGYGFIMWHDGVEFVGAEPVKWWLSSLDKPDLSVTWAEQFPRYPRYAVSYDHIYPELTVEEQQKKHWPDKGESVYYEVHVKNVGFKPSEPTDFVCTIDGKEVERKTIPALDPRKEITVKVPWTWKKQACKWEARVDTTDKMEEITKKNNTLAFQTDAYTLLAVCEKGMTERSRNEKQKN